MREISESARQLFSSSTYNDAHKYARLTLTACLAQSAERKALNLVVVGSSPTVGALLEFAREANSIATSVPRVSLTHGIAYTPCGVRARDLWLIRPSL